MLVVFLLLDQAEGWLVIVLPAVSGVSTGFFNPGRRAMLPILCDKSHLRSAMALSQTRQASMRMGGALLALSTPRVRWWLWLRQMYADVSKEDWLRSSEGDR